MEGNTLAILNTFATVDTLAVSARLSTVDTLVVSARPATVDTLAVLDRPATVDTLAVLDRLATLDRLAFPGELRFYLACFSRLLFAPGFSRGGLAAIATQRASARLPNRFSISVRQAFPRAGPPH